MRGHPRTRSVELAAWAAATLTCAFGPNPALLTPRPSWTEGENRVYWINNRP